MEPYGIIYLLIDCTNDLEYVGQTTQTFERRFSGHLCGDQYIDRVIRARGTDMIESAILKVCYSKEELDYYERLFIKSRDTMAPNGYNLSEGGDCARGYHYTEAALANMSAAQKKRFEDPAERQKVADGVSAHFSKPGKREAQSVRIKEAFQKPGVSEAISERQKKRFEDPAEHEKVSIGLKKFYAEHPEAALAISERNKGRQDSDETRKRKSQGQKARQARLRLERMPEMIAQQNRAAAKWKPLPIDLKNFHPEHPDDIKKVFAGAKRLKEIQRKAKCRAKRNLLKKIAESNLEASQLPAKLDLSKARP